MKRLAHAYQLHGLLKKRRYPVPLKTILNELECSESTFRRTRRFFVHILGAPLEHDRRRGGYRYRPGEEDFELPGIWLNSRELAALVTLEVLAGESSGIFRDLLEPIRKRTEELAGAQAFSLEELHRIRVLPMGLRRVDETTFKHCAEAVLKRRRLRIVYNSPSSAEKERDGLQDKQSLTHTGQRPSTHEKSREISPQRLVRYRDNWYLDAWCHLRKDLRTFSLNRISEIALYNKVCREIPKSKLDKHFAEAYGIFAGRVKGEAHLIFNTEHAQRVAQEEWHPKQRGRLLPDGRYELKFPFGETTELVMDILRYGNGVEVAGPRDLRKEIKERIRRMAKLYEK